MQVKCLSNARNTLSQDLLQEWPGKGPDSFPLIVDKIYVVYAMTVELGYVWYFLCDEGYIYYPMWHPCSLFEVIHNKISRYWVYTYIRKKGYVARPIWAFPEWVENPGYYDRLTNGRDEGYDKEVDLFEKYKELMDLEFPDPSVSESASIVDTEWLMCNSCIDAWHSTNVLDALVRCPYCQQKLNNPRYIPDFRSSNIKEKLNSKQNQIVESNAKRYQDLEHEIEVAHEKKIDQEMDKKADTTKAQDQTYSNKQHEIKKNDIQT